MFGNTKFPVHNTEKYRYIEIKGNGKSKPLVMLHGMFGGLSNFDPLLEEFGGYHVFVPEIPLYEFPRVKLTIPVITDWLRKQLVSHHISDPVLLGNSMGGHIALEYARKYPGSACGLVLTGSSGLMENDFGASRPKRYDREYIKERASLTFYEDLVTDTIIDEILDVLSDPEKLGRLLKLARSTHSYNMEDELKHIKQPTLLVWGRNDRITPPEVAETFLEKLPRATLKWIDRCGHAPMMERPAEFADYLKDFLQKLESKPSTSNIHSNEKDYSQF